MKKLQFANKLITYLNSKTNAAFLLKPKEVDLNLLSDYVIDQLEKLERIENHLGKAGLSIQKFDKNN